MTLLSKLCDGADWFRPEVLEIIQNELREIPRFHRKQWEFAMIFLVLRKFGLVRSDKVGLSMGGGKERLLYAIARHIKQLVVTDLYTAQTDWDCAKTDDPEAFVRSDKPFPVDNSKLEVLRMDMRDLKFPDRTFDFCYSSCAVEHIGTRSDFMKHFNEVARVLKDDGVYVMTTEVHYGDKTIEDQNNYVFSPNYLTELLAESQLIPIDDCDARIAHHAINFPLPSNINKLLYNGSGHMVTGLLDNTPHVQLLRGSHPFTSGLFILRKRSNEATKRELAFPGIEESRKFMETGVATYRHLLESSTITLDPFSFLPNGLSICCSDHSEFFVSQVSKGGNSETVFHTEYFWLGSGARTFEVSLECAENSEDNSEIELRLHRFRTLASSDVECVAQLCVQLSAGRHLVSSIEAQVLEDYCYALLAKVKRGKPVCDYIKIRSFPSRTPIHSVDDGEIVETGEQTIS